ncbi:MAG: endolytic transglycosylase MltG, partial [Gammaproteobacteria bacterium]
WTFREVMSAVKDHPALNITLDDNINEFIMSVLGSPAFSPEGQFFPDTYHFPYGTTDIEFLRRSHRQLQSVLLDEWEKRSENLPYQQAYDALIMASLIEKETGIPEERDRIAGVFVRRLARGMRLQTDPTVIYAMGKNFDGNIRRKDLDIDSPYNTYRNPGLPPTPIALAGREAIHAALHPSDGKDLYFVATGDGGHYFSETLEEHNKAVRKYQLGQ